MGKILTEIFQCPVSAKFKYSLLSYFYLCPNTVQNLFIEEIYIFLNHKGHCNLESKNFIQLFKDMVLILNNLLCYMLKANFIFQEPTKMEGYNV